MKKTTLAAIAAGIYLAIAPINGLHSQPATNPPATTSQQSAITSQQTEEDRRFLEAYQRVKDHQSEIRPDAWAQSNLQWSGSAMRGNTALAVIRTPSAERLYQLNPAEGIRQEIADIPTSGNPFAADGLIRRFRDNPVYSGEGTILYSIALEPPPHPERLIYRNPLLPGLNDCPLCASADVEYWQRPPGGGPSLVTTKKRWEREHQGKALLPRRESPIDDAIRRSAEPIMGPLPYLIKIFR